MIVSFSMIIAFLSFSEYVLSLPDSLINCWRCLLNVLTYSFPYSQLGTTALMVASYYGHIDCVRELVLQGADINLQREVGEVVHSNKDWLSDHWFITNNKKSVACCFLPVVYLSFAMQCMYEQSLFSWGHRGIGCLEFIIENEVAEVHF